MEACKEKKGTRTGADRHRVANEELCQECVIGEKKYYADWEVNNREKRKAIKARNRTPEKAWAEKLWYGYKLTPDSYNELLKSQNGECAVCSRTESKNGYRLSVDHDHSCCSGRRSCGKCVRGLLCNNCNRALGMVQDSISNLYGLINYLEKF